MELDVVGPPLQDAAPMTEVAAQAGAKAAALWVSLCRPEKVDLNARSVALRCDATGAVVAVGRGPVLAALSMTARDPVVALAPASVPAGHTVFMQCSGRRKLPQGTVVARVPAAASLPSKRSVATKRPREAAETSMTGLPAGPGRQAVCLFRGDSEEMRRCRADDPLKWCRAPTVVAGGAEWRRVHPHVLVAAVGRERRATPSVVCLVGDAVLEGLPYSRGADVVRWAPGVAAAIGRRHGAGSHTALLLQLPHLHRATQEQLDDVLRPVVAACAALGPDAALTVVISVVSQQQPSPAAGAGLWDLFVKHAREAPAAAEHSVVVGAADAAAVAAHAGLRHCTPAEFPVL